MVDCMVYFFFTGPLWYFYFTTHFGPHLAQSIWFMVYSDHNLLMVDFMVHFFHRAFMVFLFYDTFWSINPIIKLRHISTRGLAEITGLVYLPLYRRKTPI